MPGARRKPEAAWCPSWRTRTCLAPTCRRLWHPPGRVCGSTRNISSLGHDAINTVEAESCTVPMPHVEGLLKEDLPLVVGHAAKQASWSCFSCSSLIFWQGRTASCAASATSKPGTWGNFDAWMTAPVKGAPQRRHGRSASRGLSLLRGNCWQPRLRGTELDNASCFKPMFTAFAGARSGGRGAAPATGRPPCTWTTSSAARATPARRRRPRLRQSLPAPAPAPYAPALVGE